MQPSLPILFFVNDSLIAQGLHAPYIKHGALRPLSKAFFCPRCGELWARVVVGVDTNWEVFTRECPRCPSNWPVHAPEGSLMLEWDKEYMASWPLAVWQYEAYNAARLDN